MSTNLKSAGSSVVPYSEMLGLLAPIDRDDPPEEQKRKREERRRNYSPLLDYLRKTCDAIDSTDKSERLEIYRTQVKSHCFYAGRQIGYVDTYGAWVTSSRPEDQIYIDPQYQSHVDTALVEVARSRTELNCDPVIEDEPALKEAAEYARDRLDDIRKRKMSAAFSLREALFLILSGTAIRYTYFSTDVEGEVEQVAVTEQREVAATSTEVCYYCSGPLQQGAVREDGYLNHPCPHCQGNKGRIVSSPAVKANVVTGWQEVPAGEVVVESVDPAEINVSLHARTVAESPYLHRRRLVMRALLEEKFETEIPSTGITDERLKLQRELEGDPARAGSWVGTNDNHDNHDNPDRNGSRETFTGGEQFELVEFDQFWLDPCLYRQYVLPQDAELIIGIKINAGERLIDKFPDGLLIQKVGKKILDLRNESKNKHWSGCPFRIRPTSFYGGGFEHLIPLQEQANTLRSLQFVDVHYNSIRREFINTQTGVTAGDLSNNPEDAVEVDSLDPQYGLANAYMSISGQTSLSHTMPLAQEIRGDMQNAAGTFSSTGGAADLKMMGTATGAAIMREMQTNRYSPSLWLRAEMDAEQGYQLLELEQKNWSRERFERMKGKYGERAVETFRQINLRAYIRIEPVPGSWMPQSDVQRVANTEAYVAMLMNTRQAVPDEVLALAADAYRVPFQAADYSAAERIVAENVEKFSAIAAFLESQGYADPTYAQVVYEQSGCSPNVWLDNFDALREEYKDWHLSDQGRKASPLLKATIDLAVEHVYRAKAEFVRRMAELEQTAQEPQLKTQAMIQLAQEGARQQAMEHDVAVQLEQTAAENQMMAEDREHKALTDITAKLYAAGIDRAKREEVSP